MRNKILSTFLIVFIFFGAFLITTILTDMIDRATGYYDEGIAESRSVGQ